MTEGAVVFGMGGLCLSPSFVRRVAQKGLLAGNGKELSPRLRQQIAPMDLQPVAVALEARKLGLRTRDRRRIRDFFDDKLGFARRRFGAEQPQRKLKWRVREGIRTGCPAREKLFGLGNVFRMIVEVQEIRQHRLARRRVAL